MEKKFEIPEEDMENIAEIYKSLPESIRTGWLMSGSMLVFSGKLREQEPIKRRRKPKEVV